MQISSRRYGDVVVAAPTGRIDHANADSLSAALAPFVDGAANGTAALVLDFSGVDYISSVGLRVLMMAAKQVRGQARRIGVAAPQPMVREIFEISRFNMVLDLSPTVRGGIERLSPDAAKAYDTAERAGAP